jgi:hypothetical protein
MGSRQNNAERLGMRLMADGMVSSKWAWLLAMKSSVRGVALGATPTHPARLGRVSGGRALRSRLRRRQLRWGTVEEMLEFFPLAHQLNVSLLCPGDLAGHLHETVD